MKVPDICRNKSIIAKNVVLFVKKKIAINISQYPITTTQVSALKIGIQKTVSIINCLAGESSITFNKPNQKKIIKRGRRIKKSFVLNLVFGEVLNGMDVVDSIEQDEYQC